MDTMDQQGRARCAGARLPHLPVVDEKRFAALDCSCNAEVLAFGRLALAAHRQHHLANVPAARRTIDEFRVIKGRLGGGVVVGPPENALCLVPIVSAFDHELIVRALKI